MVLSKNIKSRRTKIMNKKYTKKGTHKKRRNVSKTYRRVKSVPGTRIVRKLKKKRLGGGTDGSDTINKIERKLDGDTKNEIGILLPNLNTGSRISPSEIGITLKVLIENFVKWVRALLKNNRIKHIKDFYLKKSDGVVYKFNEDTLEQLQKTFEMMPPENVRYFFARIYASDSILGFTTSKGPYFGDSKGIHYKLNKFIHDERTVDDVILEWGVNYKDLIIPEEDVSFREIKTLNQRSGLVSHKQKEQLTKLKGGILQLKKMIQGCTRTDKELKRLIGGFIARSEEIRITARDNGYGGSDRYVRGVELNEMSDPPFEEEHYDEGGPVDDRYFRLTSDDGESAYWEEYGDESWPYANIDPL
jgi:hypothetical protein